MARELTVRLFSRFKLVDLPNLTTTFPGTALGRTTSTLSVLFAFLPLSISLFALVNDSRAARGTGRVSTWLYHRARWGRPGFFMDPTAATLPRIVPQMRASPKPNWAPAKYVLDLVSMVSYCGREEELPVGKVIVKGIKNLLDLRERCVALEHSGHRREGDLLVRSTSPEYGEYTYLLSWKSLLELGSNSFDSLDIAISRLRELTSFLPLYLRVFKERK
jgi:hypothetical protein